MNLTIPFELDEPVYILKDIERCNGQVWIPPDYSKGGDADGPFQPGYYQNTYEIITEIKKIKFHFGLLDNYKINEIYKTYEDAHWALLNKEVNRDE